MSSLKQCTVSTKSLFSYVISVQDNFIGANETIFNLKLTGSYPPYTEGVEDGIFIMDPRDDTKILEGEVRMTYVI